MESRRTASLKISYRPALGEVAIAACMAGGIAALSTAGIALPIERIGFDGDWDARSPAADRAPSVRSVAARPQSSVVFPRPVFDPAPVAESGQTGLASMPPVAPVRFEAVSALQRIRALQEVAPPSLISLPSAQVEVIAQAPSPVSPATAETRLAAIAPQTVAPAELIASARPEVVDATVAVPLAIINAPELKGFDLARVGSNAKAPEVGLAVPVAARVTNSAVQAKPGKDRVLGEDIFHQISLSVAGSAGQAVDVRIGADMKPSLRVGDLVGLVSDRLDADSVARFTSAAAAGDYVSLATLRAAGFEVSYNAGANSIAIDLSN